RHGTRPGRARRHATGVPRRGRGAPLQRPGRRAALRDVPEPVAGRFERADRPRPAARGVRPDARRTQRRRDPRLPGGALRRVRALSPALRRPHLDPVAGSGPAAAGRHRGGGAHRAQPQPPAPAGGGGPGMVSTVVLYAVLVLAALLVAALVAWPLRRGSPRVFAAVLVAVPMMTLPLYQLVGTPAAL